MAQSVLMICYYYPPLGGIGSQRSQKFARYLPDCGWHPLVLTPERGCYFVDRSLDDGSTSGVEVVRTQAIDLSSIFKRAASNGRAFNGSSDAAQLDLRQVEGGPVVKFLKRAVRNWVYIPDGQVGWYPYAIREGRRMIESRGVDAIYSTSFPVTAHAAASRLKAITGKPWVADFRDLWTENHYNNYLSGIRKRLDQIIESNLLEAADAIVTVSDTWAETLRRLSGGRKRVEVIRNGFDASEFATLEQSRPPKWTITYVGSFYGSKQDPTPLLETLKRLIESGKIPRDDAQLKIVGEPEEYVQNLVASFDLASVTHFTGFVSHRESLAHQVGSSLLLMILHSDTTNSGHVPGKLYEYIGARRPILAIIPAGFEAARIIRDAQAGVTVQATDHAAIERALIDSYAAYKSGDDRLPDNRDISAHERSHGARKLAGLLSELTGN